MDIPQHETAAETPVSARPAIEWTHPAVFVATGFWIGRMPFMPGTWGALWGLPLSWAILLMPAIWARLLVTVAACLIGIPICTAAVLRFGGKKDPGAIVLDEICSMPLVFTFVPLAVFTHPAIWITGFVLHRVFDITKCCRARQLVAFPEGLGIMADDWAAGVFAAGAPGAALVRRFRRNLAGRCLVQLLKLSRVARGNSVARVAQRQEAVCGRRF